MNLDENYKQDVIILNSSGASLSTLAVFQTELFAYMSKTSKKQIPVAIFRIIR